MPFAITLADPGDRAAAMNEFELSTKRSPGKAWVYDHRAQVDDLARDWQNAIAGYRQALVKRDPALNPVSKKHAEMRILELFTRG